MATIPSVAAKTTGDNIDSTYLASIKSCIDFNWAPPEVQVYDGSGVVMTNATFTLLTWDTESYDTDSMHGTSTTLSSSLSNSRITINTTGRYRIDIQVQLPSATYTVYAVNMRANAGGSNSGGTSVLTWQNGSPGGGPLGFSRSVTTQLNSGNYYEFFVSQTSGANRTTQTGNLVTGVTFTWLHP